ncbi:phage tail protein [Celerinatantimonas yamalensis]|uniref:Tail fiber protein n=1 Tax=Celerinatantimonas yamalensis TaxID=559956 RepID=A0ABW9G9C2_9GAMM
MSDPFLGEIRMFAGDYAPKAWGFCDGQIMNIASNDALFSLLGTSYGGDGVTTFALPDMRGRIPVHCGQGNGLTNRPLGSRYGSERVPLTEQQMPVHRHTMYASTDAAVDSQPEGRVTAVADPGFYSEGQNSSFIVDYPESAMSDTGEGNTHDNVMPSLVIHFIMAFNGLYPQRD